MNMTQKIILLICSFSVSAFAGGTETINANVLAINMFNGSVGSSWNRMDNVGIKTAEIIDRIDSRSQTSSAKGFHLRIDVADEFGTRRVSCAAFGSMVKCVEARQELLNQVKAGKKLKLTYSSGQVVDVSVE